MVLVVGNCANKISCSQGTSLSCMTLFTRIGKIILKENSTIEQLIILRFFEEVS